MNDFNETNNPSEDDRDCDGGAIQALFIVGSISVFWFAAGFLAHWASLKIF